MAKSELRTKVAILRAAIGISMKDFAALTGRSFFTWKALEAGRLPLSEKLAATISKETGVAMSWLLDEAQTGPPIGGSGEPLTREGFERHRAWGQISELIPRSGDRKEPLIDIMTERFRWILEAAEEAEGRTVKFLVLVFRAGKFLDELEQEYFREFSSDKSRLPYPPRPPKKFSGSEKKPP
jgi:hypothetical protein